MLNAYLKDLPLGNFRTYILCFLLIDILLGWCMHSPAFHHVFLFMLLYSIGYYLRRDDSIGRVSTKVYLAGWFMATVIIFVSLFLRLGGVLGQLGYTHPVIIFQAVMILVLFARVRLESAKVNYLAKSALMVYLMSENIHMRGYFADVVQTVCRSSHGVVLYVSLAALFVLTYFALLLLDKLLGKIYRPMLNRLLTVCHL